MTVQQLAQALGCKLLAGEAGLENQVTGCYAGDLLSWVMGRAAEGQAWITVMGNVNAIAVAKLLDLSCILLCDNAPLDDEAKKQAGLGGVPVLLSGKAAYELAVEIARLLGDAA